MSVIRKAQGVGRWLLNGRDPAFHRPGSEEGWGAPGCEPSLGVRAGLGEVDSHRESVPAGQRPSTRASLVLHG